MFGILFLIYLRNVFDELLVLNHTNNPRLAINTARCVDSATYHHLQLLVFYWFVQILTNGTTIHNGIDYVIGIEFHAYVSLNVRHFVRWLVTFEHLTILRDKKFGEVPSDKGLIAVFLVIHGCKFVQRRVLQSLAEAVKGLKKGDVKDYETKEGNDTLSFHVTVDEIKYKKLPALDDNFAKDMGFETLDALKAKVKENLDAQAQRDAERDEVKQIEDA